MRLFAALWLTFALVAFSGGAASGHGASTSYLAVTVEDDTAAVAWSIALRDLDDAIGLDRTGDGAVTWGDVRLQARKIDSYALARLNVTTSGAHCVPSDDVAHLIDDSGDGAYVVLRFQLECPISIGGLDFAYSALFDIDPRHRGLLSVTMNGTTRTAMLAPEAPNASFGATPGLLGLASAYFAGGVRHLLDGSDHQLFILMLLIPALLRPSPDGLGGRGGSPDAWSTTARLIEVVRLLTAFTLAHSVSLTLAVLDVMRVPSAIVEPAIALTILLTALDNLWPFLPARRWIFALGFGLIHGLGVAGGLGPLHLPPVTLAIALLAFNLGLEAVQVGIALAATPLGLAVRMVPGLPRRLLPVVSGGAMVLATVWFAQRVEIPLARAAMPGFALSIPWSGDTATHR